MLVFVQETNTVYQYSIDNYSTLWNAAEGAGSITDFGTGYEVYNDTPQGQAFIDV
jgi:hypothetical protein